MKQKNSFSLLMNQTIRSVIHFYYDSPWVIILLFHSKIRDYQQVVIWDAITSEKVAMWPSNHIGAPRWIEHSPTESAFVSCGNDRSVRFWKDIS